MNNEDRIIAYIIGEMVSDERDAFEKELQESPLLQKELEEYRSVFSVIHDIETSELPASAQDRFNAMLDEEIRNQDKTPTKVVSLKPNYWKVISIAASFALLGVFIGYQLQHQPINTEAVAGLSVEQKQKFNHLVRQDRTSQKIDGLVMVESVELLEDEVLNTLEEVLFNDPSTNVRLAVIDALRIHADQENVKEVLIKGLENIEKPVIKIAIIQAITGTESKQLLPALERALEDEAIDKSVQDELHLGIMKLSKNS